MFRIKWALALIFVTAPFCIASAQDDCPIYSGFSKSEWKEYLSTTESAHLFIGLRGDLHEEPLDVLVISNSVRILPADILVVIRHEDDLGSCYNSDTLIVEKPGIITCEWGGYEASRANISDLFVFVNNITIDGSEDLEVICAKNQASDIELDFFACVHLPAPTDE